MNDETLKVWAPGKRRVELALGDGRRAMREVSGTGGWWQSEEPLPAGTRYGFVIDGEGPFPDPRSPSQPDGVHRLSETVDHRSYPWRDAGWQPPRWEDAVVYELHVGTFSASGNFRGVIGHLDSLVELGVTHLELMPVCEFPGTRGWGYDGVSLFAPHHAYGGPEGLRVLVDACHARGLAVIIDVVYNHLGPDGNYLPIYGPYFTDRYVTPWGDAPNLDGPDCGPVRRFFIDNALMWLRDYHADGLRLDAIDKVIDRSEKHFLVELGEQVRELERETGRRKILVAESASNDPVFVRPPEQGGYGMEAQWSDDLHHAMRTVFTGEREGYLADYGDPAMWAKALRRGFVYEGQLSKFRGRAHGKPADGLPGHAFLGYLQNHDQIGNRATGDRFHHHPAVGPVHQRIASAFTILSPFVPMIFMGEEWAAGTPFQYFTDHEDPDLARAVSEGRKREFGEIGWAPEDVPDPQAIAAFEDSKLDWDERAGKAHAEMLGWYRALIRLRRSDPALGSESMTNVRAEADPEGRWIWMRRGPFLIVAALRGREVFVPLTSAIDSPPLLAGGCLPVTTAGSGFHFRTAGVAIYKEDF